MTKVTQTSKRKSDHIRINLEEDVESTLSAGFDDLSFIHNATPELNLVDVSCSTSFLEHQLDLPLLISSMTGGSKDAEPINRILAEAAQMRGLAMGLGSQRVAIEDPQQAVSFQVRKYAPDILLFSNLGAVQLNYGYGISECKRAVEISDADALVLHLNPLQEALQPEGDVNFKGLLGQIESVCNALEVPVIAKEVGWGISQHTARQLIDAGVAVIDVAGAGGTSWSQVEHFRSKDVKMASAALAFRKWGIPTSIAVAQIREALPSTPIIASGGMRSGLDVAKSIALGADLSGLAGPFLKAASRSLEDVLDLIDRLHLEIQICMFATGCASIDELRDAELVNYT
jgi:isopentenyl-diphosphate delta-isomerase